MKKDDFYPMLVAKMQEVSSLPPQQIGPFTPFYKLVVPRFKYSPWKSALAFSLFGSLLLYLIFGSLVVRLASILQFGF